MQKEDAIKIYKSFASPMKAVAIDFPISVAAWFLIDLPGDNIISMLCEIIVAAIIGFILASLYVVVKIIKDLQKITAVLDDELDRERLLEIVEHAIFYGKDSKKEMDAGLFYSEMQEIYVRALIINGKNDEAEKYLEKGEMDKSDQSYVIARALLDLNIAYNQGNVEEYVDIFSKAPKAVKNVKINVCIGLIMQGKYDEAIELLTNYAAKSKREELLCNFYLAQSYLKKEMPEEAKPHLEYVIENGKTLPEKYRAEELYKAL